MLGNDRSGGDWSSAVCLAAQYQNVHINLHYNLFSSLFGLPTHTLCSVCIFICADICSHIGLVIQKTINNCVYMIYKMLTFLYFGINCPGQPTPTTHIDDCKIYILLTMPYIIDLLAVCLWVFLFSIYIKFIMIVLWFYSIISSCICCLRNERTVCIMIYCLAIHSFDSESHFLLYCRLDIIHQSFDLSDPLFRIWVLDSRRVQCVIWPTSNRFRVIPRTLKPRWGLRSRAWLKSYEIKQSHSSVSSRDWIRLIEAIRLLIQNYYK